MSGTSGFLQPSSSTILLPAPRIELQEYGNPPASSLVFDGTVGGVTVDLYRCPQVTVMEIPTGLYAPEYDLRIELLRYRRGARISRWTHPNCEVIPPIGSKFRSGSHSNSITGYPRQSEWVVTSETQRIVFADLHKYFIVRSVAYRVGLNTNNQTPVAVPSYKGNKGNLTVGAKWHYASGYTPNYFAWRYSILDLESDKYRRLTGPLSKVVSVAHRAHPFLFDYATSAQVGQKCATINPAFDVKQLECFFETRLP